MVAFQVLYGLSFATVTTREELERAFLSYPTKETAEGKAEECGTEQPQGFAWELVSGVWEQQAALDESISRYSQNWKLERIGHIELTLLRLAFFELFFRSDTPPRVVINEVLELSTHFAEISAKKFINGLLDAAVKDKDKNQNCQVKRADRDPQ